LFKEIPVAKEKIYFYNFLFKEIAKEKTAGLWSGLTGSAAFQKVNHFFQNT
jgi:hypothetical protein